MTNRVRVTLAGVICTLAQCLYQVGRLKRIRSITAQTCDKYIYISDVVLEDRPWP